MKDYLHDLQGMLVYILEFVVNGQPRSVVLVPNVASDNALLEETAEGSGVMRGKLVSGGFMEVPADCITNVFASWWKKTDKQSGQGVKSWWLDDEVAGNHASNDVGKSEKWDENGCHKEIEGREKLPNDVPSSRVVRGDGGKKWWE